MWSPKLVIQYFLMQDQFFYEKMLVDRNVVRNLHFYASEGIIF